MTSLIGQSYAEQPRSDSVLVKADRQKEYAAPLILSYIEPSVDLRKRKSRSFSELVGILGGFLPESDRALLQAVFCRGARVAEMAQVARICPRRMSRKLRLLVKRVSDPAFRFVVSRRDAWSPTVRQIATEFYINGRSERTIAREMGLSYHAVRRHVEGLRLLVDAAEGQVTAHRRAEVA